MAPIKTQANILIHFACWEDFVRFSKQAAIAVYTLKATAGIFRVCAMKGNVLVYEEELPLPHKTRLMKSEGGWEAEIPTITDIERSEWVSKFSIISRQIIRKTFKCGVSYSILPKLVREKDKWNVEFEYQLDHKKVLNLLSNTLNVPQEHVIQGDILEMRKR